MQIPYSAIDLASTLPLIVACTFGMLVLLLEAFQRQALSRAYLAYVTALGFVLTGLSATPLFGMEPMSAFGGTNYLDGFTQACTILFCLGGALTAVMSGAWLEEHQIGRGEYYALLLFAVGGMTTMVSAGDFVVFFVALEIMSVAIYALAAYNRRSSASAEAGLKYFLLGAFASAVLLLGIALVYGATGSTQFAAIGDALASGSGAADAQVLANTAQHALALTAAGYDPSVAGFATNTSVFGLPLAALGVGLIFAAFAFKVAAVPFHMWAPDVYAGSPTPAVGFMAATVKASGFLAMVRIFALAFGGEASSMSAEGWVQLAFWVALASMIVGNLVALAQTSLRRMLAYSSIAHAGYLLVALTGMGFGATNIDLSSSILFYLFAYSFATIGAFGVLTWLGRPGQEVDSFDDLNGLGLKYPAAGLALTVFMLSSAGIPPAAGFIGKFLVFRSAIAASTAASEAGVATAHMPLILVIAGILFSVAGVAYYLRVLVHLYMKKPSRTFEPLHDTGLKLAIAACVILTLGVGILPGRLASYTDLAVERMMDRPDGVYTLAADESAR